MTLYLGYFAFGWAGLTLVFHMLSTFITPTPEGDFDIINARNAVVRNLMLALIVAAICLK